MADPGPDPTAAPAGKLADNIMHFGRVLRAAGLPAGPGTVIDAVHAVERAGIARRDDFYWTLHAVFVHRFDQRSVFDQAFHTFWRNPEILQRMMSLLLPHLRGPAEETTPPPASRRVAEALNLGQEGRERGAEEGIEFDAALTYSGREVLQKLDFEKMSVAELAQARRMVARLALPLARMPTRRHQAAARGALVDMRASFRALLRAGGTAIPLSRRRRRTRPPPLVVLCDISGSMGRYSRMLLHFMHAVANDRDRVHCFVFGTRLTNITRHLSHKDVDVALDAVTEAVEDWSGGTRIGDSFRAFNRDWSRRVLGQGALVVLITDGLDREGGADLTAEIDRLHRSCRRLIWLNPLLRYSGFEPKSLGVRAMLPHVDEFRPIHNLDSLADLARALAADGKWRDSKGESDVGGS
ncbi:MAG: VWA domain-containing protein [Alphaproteobacteria bacterium]|jgi:hypothetical protein|nr:VWA domain-containing protein [Alphaproteobacteria bacterium]MDP6515242.1 VWA domain-containing protein [Alphaproteobacteria bacterium]